MLIRTNKEMGDRDFTVSVISVLIGALIIRVIYVTLDSLRVTVEDIVDDREREGGRYKECSYHLLNWFLVLTVAIFGCILLYTFYRNGYTER